VESSINDGLFSWRKNVSGAYSSGCSGGEDFCVEMERSKRGMEDKREGVAIVSENYGREVAKLKHQGKENGEEYKAVLEKYMRKSCEVMRAKYERGTQFIVGVARKFFDVEGSS
jgi:hypothetical protein